MMREENNQVFNEEDMPEDCFCPITHEIMREPVIAADGHSYEKSAIKKWFDQGRNISPKTGAKLENMILIPNYALRNLISSLEEKIQKLTGLEKQITELGLQLSNSKESTENVTNVNTKNSFFYKKVAITPEVNVILQNQLIEKISQSQLESVQDLLAQGALLTEPDKNGVYPLTAAVYSCDILTIKYIDEKLGPAAGIYWSKVDLEHFKQYMQAQMPERRPTGICRASYEWLANWYCANANKLWNAKYDKFIVDNWFKSGVEGWNEKNWQERGERISRSKGNFAKEIWTGYEWNSYKIYRPPVSTHDESVYEIISELIQCSHYVKSKIEEQKLAMRFEP